MKRLAAIALTLTLGACATAGGQSARITEGKALADAWASLGGAAAGADAAVRVGALHGAPAATVSADLKKASAYLDIATDAYQANATDISSQLVVATAAIAEAVRITGAAK